MKKLLIILSSIAFIIISCTNADKTGIPNNNENINKIDSKYQGNYIFEGGQINIYEDGSINYNGLEGTVDFVSGTSYTIKFENGTIINIDFTNSNPTISINGKDYKTQKSEISKYYGIYKYSDDIYFEINKDNNEYIMLYHRYYEHENIIVGFFSTTYVKEINQNTYTLTNSSPEEHKKVAIITFNDDYANITIDDITKNNIKRIKGIGDFAGTYKEENNPNNIIKINADNSVEISVNGRKESYDDIYEVSSGRQNNDGIGFVYVDRDTSDKIFYEYFINAKDFIDKNATYFNLTITKLEKIDESSYKTIDISEPYKYIRE